MGPSIANQARPQSWLQAFVEGFGTPLAGLRFMNAHPRLWGYAVLPILLNLVLTTLFLGGLVWGGVELFIYLHGLIHSGWVPDWLTWLAVVGEVLLGAALAVVILLFAIALWLVFQGILCGYFYSELAKRVELILGMRQEDIREVPLVYQVVDALLDVTFVSFIAVSCFVMSFIPIVGPIAAVVIGGYFNAMVYGMDYLDYPQALRARGRRVQRGYARKHRAHTLGLGACVTLITFVPIVNAFFLTTAATGAVLLYRRLGGPGTASTSTMLR
ncbi:MAG: EI24 domain-containing protein [Opitutaceae bacterium]|nr:EI24 domain-containing protein [Opitutaceae bacterium]